MNTIILFNSLQTASRLSQERLGTFVKTNIETLALDGAQFPRNFRGLITNATGEKAYPICCFTWLIGPAEFAS